MIILAQVIGFLGLTIHVLSFQQKTRGKVLLFTMIGCLFWALHFSLLGFYTAAAVNLVVALRSLVFYKFTNRDNRLMLYGFMAAFVISTIFTWQGIISLLPLAACLLSTYASWQMSAQRIRQLTLPMPMLWFIHNFIAGSIAAMIADTSLFISIVVGLWRYRRGTKPSKTIQDTA